ncbi:hypothetical protein VTJ83DRAFT_6352 [Remersonia thermophila]|uniref:Mitochondrial resolvase Ydc2 catalytic domain-containing protein n=1 Tax=Remersonia thermophila TaxID=72144 RepID=A0ABR4D4G1_9PEZI
MNERIDGEGWNVSPPQQRSLKIHLTWLPYQSATQLVIILLRSCSPTTQRQANPAPPGRSSQQSPDPSIKYTRHTPTLPGTREIPPPPLQKKKKKREMAHRPVDPLLRETVATLQALCASCGLPKTGAKAVLARRLRLAAQRFRPLPRDARLLSLDLGVKNFGLSLVSPASACDPAKAGKGTASGNGTGSGESGSPGASGVLRTPVRLLAWERIDLTSLTSSSSSSTTTTTTTPSSASEESDFSPVSLAASTLGLVTSRLLPLRPTHVLIERQRFRTAGAAAVLEWTVRVNSLEAMLHAAFAALNRESREAGRALPGEGADGEGSGGGGDSGGAVGPPASLSPWWWWRGRVESVTPKLVAGFLLPGAGKTAAEEGEEGEDEASGGKKKKKKPKKKGGASSAYQLLKQEKIKILTGLLSEGMVQPDEGRAADVVSRFLAAAERKSAGTRRRKGATGDAELEDIGKMDDLSDSLLQGMTWVQWQSNLEALIRERPELLEPVANDDVDGADDADVNGGQALAQET